MTEIARLTLDVCTPEGKTWCAKLVGLNPKFTFEREFINASEDNTTRSGRTGSKTYTLVEDGIYQSREGRRSLRGRDVRDHNGNRFYLVQDGDITIITQTEAIEELRRPAAPQTHAADPQPGEQDRRWSGGTR